MEKIRIFHILSLFFVLACSGEAKEEELSPDSAPQLALTISPSMSHVHMAEVAVATMFTFMALFHPLKEDLESSTLREPFSSVLKQDYNDCVINAVASAIEYLTIPRTAKARENPFYPLKVSRSGLYTLAKYHSFSSSDEWKADDTQGWKHDYGVDMGTALMTISKYGCFPENSVTLSTGYKVPGWEYDRQSLSIAPDILRLGLEHQFDGIRPVMKPILLQSSVVQKKDLCELENPYAKIHSQLVYEPIERPCTFDSVFYEKIKAYLKANQPIIIGISATEDFIKGEEEELIQGLGSKAGDFHVVLLLGYGNFRSFKDCFYVQNSWGTTWAGQGRGYLSKKYFEENFYGGYALSLPGFFEGS